MSLVILLLANPVLAEDEICFRDDTAKGMVVELEKSRIFQQQVYLLQQQNAELEKQIAMMKEVQALQQAQLDISKKVIKDMQDIVEYQGDAYEKAVKKTKPGALYQMGEYLGFIGIGILIGLLL